MNDQSEERRPLWLYTQRVRSYVNKSPHGSLEGGPNGIYMGRPVIGRDSRIQGGISMVDGYPILIVVSEKDVQLPRAYKELTDRIARWDAHEVETLLKLVHDFVREKMKYVRGLNKQMEREFAPRQKEIKLPLAMYLQRKEGVCWQQGLFAAYLIEKLIDDGYLGGTVSTDRNIKRDVLKEWADFATDEFVGHQWARWTAPDGTAYIVDPAQEYCGRLADVPRNRRGFWRDYFRPEDPIPAPPPKAPALFDELDCLVAAGIVAATVWHFVF